MTIVEQYQTTIIIDDGITHKEIDLTSVNELKRKLEEKVIQRKTWKDRSSITAIAEIHEEYEKLNEDQKPYFMSYLLSRISSLSDLYLSIVEDPKSFLELSEFINKTKEQMTFPSEKL